MTKILDQDIDSLAAYVPDGACLAVFKDGGGVAMALTRALIRRGVKGLRLITVPTSGMQADLLIGAGCVASIETSGVTMGEFGQAPCFGRAVKTGSVQVTDATCPATYAALQAGEKGIPFMPFRGLLGSDVAGYHPDWKIIDNPFAENDPIVALPAIRPDVALLHVPLADRFGNVWVGCWPELKTMAHAAHTTLVTFETLYDGNLREDESLAPATLEAFYVTAMTQAERGSWPLAMRGSYAVDASHLADYCRRAASPSGLADYLHEHVFERQESAV